ncbi:hypothetical protein GGX14DRAFT_397336 [Mycena pura]|uniref:Uncharacterized protein n=1 Tax=Mycena pura TaxID=153505 RepID=A0AAD6VCQ9_9AGAR|nr:hypothetical protein GGX14DRAFT_397336 [Mycena pura]
MPEALVTMPEAMLVRLGGLKLNAGGTMHVEDLLTCLENAKFTYDAGPALGHGHRRHRAIVAIKAIVTIVTTDADAGGTEGTGAKIAEGQAIVAIVTIVTINAMPEAPKAPEGAKFIIQDGKKNS